MNDILNWVVYSFKSSNPNCLVLEYVIWIYLWCFFLWYKIVIQNVAISLEWFVLFLSCMCMWMCAYWTHWQQSKSAIYCTTDYRIQLLIEWIMFPERVQQSPLANEIAWNGSSFGYLNIFMLFGRYFRQWKADIIII